MLAAAHHRLLLKQVQHQHQLTHLQTVAAMVTMVAAAEAAETVAAEAEAAAHRLQALLHLQV